MKEERLFEPDVIRAFAAALVVFFHAYCMLLPKASMNILGVCFLYKWFFWFYLGYVVYSHRDTVYGLIRKWRILLYLLPAIYVSCMWSMVTVVGDYDKCFISEIGFLSIVIWIWYIICLAIEKFGHGWTQFKLIKELSICSFGIYIFHNWIESYIKLAPFCDDNTQMS